MIHILNHYLENLIQYKMLVFEKDNKTFCYLHLPKCSGRYIKREIKRQHKIIQEFKGTNKLTQKKYKYDGYMDRMHIPVNIFVKYFYKDKIDKFITYSRNPYHRLISAYRFTRQKKSFKDFVTSILKNKNVDAYHFGGTHFLSQCYLLNLNEPNQSNDLIITPIEDYEKGILKLNKCKNKFYNLAKFYDEETFAIVNQKYNKDIKYLGYEFLNV